MSLGDREVIRLCTHKTDKNLFRTPHKEYTQWTIKKLKDRFDQLEFNVEYQRSPDVWKLYKKRRLIDSILRDFTIGMIFLRKIEDRFEILDGQQRLRTLFEFLGHFGRDKKFSTLPTTPDFANKTCDDLRKDVINWGNFMAFQVPVFLVEYMNDEDTASLFLRLQEGMPLNMAEKLNAMKGDIRNLILKLSRHPLLEKTGIEKRRFGHRLVCAQIYFVELNGNLESEPPYFPRITFKFLRKMYEDYSDRLPPRRITTKIKRSLGLLKRILGQDASIVKYKGDFITIYSLISHVDKKFSIRGHDKEIKKFIIEFLAKVESVRKDTTLSGEIPYREYKEARRFQTTEYLKKRFDIILGKFLEQIPELRLRSRTRSFDYGQKLAIFSKHNGKCFFCHHEVKFDEAVFHHIKFYERDNGPTTVENGAPAHSKCHTRFHAEHPDKK